MKNKCVECEMYRKEIAEKGIKSFLLAHLLNEHLSEVLIEFFTDQRSCGTCGSYVCNRVCMLFGFLCESDHYCKEWRLIE